MKQKYHAGTAHRKLAVMIFVVQIIDRMQRQLLRHVVSKPALVMTSKRSSHSFIDKAAQHGAHSLLGAFPFFLGRFDEVLKNVTIDRIDPGDVQCTFQVDEANANGYGTLHGGYVATLVDVVGTLALVSKDKDKAGVSLDLNVSYMNAATIGERIVCTGRLLRVGRSFGFTEVELVREKDGKIIAKGRHTKAFQSGAKEHK